MKVPVTCEIEATQKHPRGEIALLGEKPVLISFNRVLRVDNALGSGEAAYWFKRLRT